MSNIITFYDTEFTTWEGAYENDWAEDWQHRELVQIGAVHFDLDTLKELDEFLVFVKPVKNPELSDLFTNLTGIQQMDVDQQGLDFPEAYQQFKDFIGDTKNACYGWDAKVMRENLALNNMSAEPTDFDSFDISVWFKSEGKPYGVQDKTNSGKLAEVVGADMERIQEHNAMHDARSIAAAYRFLINEKVPAPSWSIDR